MKSNVSILVIVAVVLLGGCSGLTSNTATDTELQGPSEGISTDTQAQTDTHSERSPTVDETTTLDDDGQTDTSPTDDGDVTEPPPDDGREGTETETLVNDGRSGDGSKTDTPANDNGSDDGSKTETPANDDSSGDEPKTGTPANDDSSGDEPKTGTPANDDSSDDGAKTDTPVNDDSSDDGAKTDTLANDDSSNDESKTDTPGNGSDDDNPASTTGTVALDNVTAEGICTDYSANRATFKITNHDDDTAIVYYMAADAAGGGGTVRIAPGESVRVDGIVTTDIVTGLDRGAITLFIKNAPGRNEQMINYPSDPSPCGDTIPTHPNIVFTNQTTFDSEYFAVTLTEVALPEGGFVVFSNESGAIIETRYIGAGIAHQVDLDFYHEFDHAFTIIDPGDQLTVTATLYRDTNDNGAFDPTIDHPYTSTAGTTSATATVTYGGEHP